MNNTIITVSTWLTMISIMVTMDFRANKKPGYKNMKTKLLKQVRKRFKIILKDGHYFLVDIRTNKSPFPWEVKARERLFFGLMVTKAIELTIGKFRYSNLNSDRLLRRWNKRKKNAKQLRVK